MFEGNLFIFRCINKFVANYKHIRYMIVFSLGGRKIINKIYKDGILKIGSWLKMLVMLKFPIKMLSLCVISTTLCVIFSMF